jgi:uncharacterized protein
MKKLFLVLLALFPYFPGARAVVTHADSTATRQKMEDPVVRRTKADPAFLQDLPAKSNTLVTDYTNTLTEKQIKFLELKLEAFNKATTNQIAVVILESVGDNDIMLYGRKLANSWGIGQKAKNNGVLVLVAVSDRKTAIMTGKGLERVLTDPICHNLIETDLIPNFKKNDYYIGLDQCTNDLIKHINGKK